MTGDLYLPHLVVAVGEVLYQLSTLAATTQSAMHRATRLPSEKHLEFGVHRCCHTRDSFHTFVAVCLAEQCVR